MRKFKLIWMIALIGFTVTAAAQTQPALPHGMVYGHKPDTTDLIKADDLKNLMGDKTRINTVLRDTVARVMHEKGGWFTLNTQHGKLYAHFKNYNINLPKAIEGRIVIIDAVAAKNFTADDSQHFAGDSTLQKNKKGMSGALTLEVNGLMIDK